RRSKTHTSGIEPESGIRRTCRHTRRWRACLDTIDRPQRAQCRAAQLMSCRGVRAESPASDAQTHPLSSVLARRQLRPEVNYWKLRMARDKRKGSRLYGETW